MNDHKYNNDPHNDFFDKVKIPYKKSKEDVWNEIMDKVDEKESKINFNYKKHIYWAVAASLVVLLAIGTLMRFYTAAYECPRGEHLSILLPDGSKVNINAGSTLKYHPYWWSVSRRLKLEGEAFFEVVKGNQFKVISKQGSTAVLGTSFNIYARENNYRVSCYSGEVRVKSKKGEVKIIQKDQSIEIADDGLMKSLESIEINQDIAWIKNKFVFTSESLEEVFSEIERQFKIKIELSEDVSGRYTGNFKRGSSPQNILENICKPFGFHVRKITEDHYKIIAE